MLRGGALLCKVDVSKVFHHVHIDPGDYDLLGLHWRDASMDTCLSFKARHSCHVEPNLSTPK